MEIYNSTEKDKRYILSGSAPFVAPLTHGRWLMFQGARSLLYTSGSMPPGSFGTILGISVNAHRPSFTYMATRGANYTRYTACSRGRAFRPKRFSLTGLLDWGEELSAPGRKRRQMKKKRGQGRGGEGRGAICNPYLQSHLFYSFFLCCEAAITSRAYGVLFIEYVL